MKNQMSMTTKVKLIYSIELAAFAVVFLVIGILEIVEVIHIREIVLTIFNWVTIFGGTWMIIDFIWTMTSKKRQKKNSRLDKALLLPLALYLITFDLICLIGQIDKVEQYNVYKFGVASALLYIAVIYGFQAIYHWFHPIPGLIEGVEAAEKLEKELAEAKKALENHGVIAFPTETVMGLGVYFDDEEAYNKLNKIKRRPEDKPYTMMVKSPNEISKYANVDERTQKIIKAFVPGSITLLLPAKEGLPQWVTHGGNTLGIRVPSNEMAKELLEEVDKPLLVPSANRSGEKPAMNSDEVKEIFLDELDFILEGEAKSERPSTILDLTKEEVEVVREGPITLEQINNVLKR